MARGRTLLVYFLVIGLAVLITAGVQVLLPVFSSKAARLHWPWSNDANSAEQMTQIVAGYIQSHPYEIAAALMKAEQEQVVIQARHDEIYQDSSYPFLGNPQAKTTMVEFFDYRCGHCWHFAQTLSRVLSHNQQIRIILRDFPVLGPDSDYASHVALAVGRHGKYLDFYHAIFQLEPGKVDRVAIDKVVTQIGLDASSIRSESQDPAIEGIVRRNKELAASLFIQGTPGLVIGDKVVRGEISEDELNRVISSQAQVASLTGRP